MTYCRDRKYLPGTKSYVQYLLFIWCEGAKEKETERYTEREREGHKETCRQVDTVQSVSQSVDWVETVAVKWWKSISQNVT